MMTLDEAVVEFVDSVNATQQTETVILSNSLGRVLARDIISSIDVPQQDNSAMDGFAVRASDIINDDHTLDISQRIPAGVQPTPLVVGTAARIFTGAVIPEAADAVVIQENCAIADDGTSVRIRKMVKVADHIRARGQDISKGSVVIHAGSRINAVDLGLIASVGQDQITVYEKLKVAVFSTGNELAAPGQPLAAGQIYNSNRFMLLALCQQLGFETIDCGVVEDTLEATKAALSNAAEQADFILTCGGVSVGDEDHVKPAIEALGRLEFWKVQIKPGKPVAFGSIARTPVLGLPGNPVSSYVVFQLLGIPVLRALQGVENSSLRTFFIPSNFDKKPSSREEFIRVRLMLDDDGQTVVTLFDNQSSGVLSSLAWADGLARQRIDQAISKGQLLEFLPLHEGVLI